MDAAIEFAVSGETMDFTLDRIRNGHLTPLLYLLRSLWKSASLLTTISLIQGTIYE